MNQRPCQTEALFHPSGEAVHIEIQLILQTYLFQKRGIPFSGHQTIEPVTGSKETHILSHRQVIVHTKEIRHISNLPL